LLAVPDRVKVPPLLSVTVIDQDTDEPKSSLVFGLLGGIVPDIAVPPLTERR